MSNSDNVKSIALMFNILAEIFYRNPDEEFKNTLSELDISIFITNKTNLQDLALLKIDEIKQLASQLPLLALKQDFNALFVRPKGKLAYPWGSVYLNKQNRLFDHTTLAFMDFCKLQDLNFNLEHNEPTDHFSLMLVALVHCLELDSVSGLASSQGEEGTSRTEVLLSQHLLPWSERFLTLVIDNDNSGLYSAAAQLSKLLLADLTAELSITVVEVELYK
ncbi:TorD/DmsD family molecular chaperone [Shewanella japonica]|uniref:Molecular chaperone TorD n=1 Tax=Shewanella japonica TaxID=93973 RepID=A0ABN4YEB6_9GAMM|nr:molecular chaperone TorD family protein [Shewanella japonica]ARD22513.1 hypothetical protein SJ2017_2220 [Shewanella japonica]